jgi:hypothetical protein
VGVQDLLQTATKSNNRLEAAYNIHDPEATWVVYRVQVGGGLAGTRKLQISDLVAFSTHRSLNPTQRGIFTAVSEPIGIWRLGAEMR